MKKRLIILGLIALFLSLQIALAQIKTEDFEVAYGDRKLIDLNKKSPYTIKLHETSLLSFRYPGRTKNTMLVNNISRQGINVTMLGDAFKPGLNASPNIVTLMPCLLMLLTSIVFLVLPGYLKLSKDVSCSFMVYGDFLFKSINFLSPYATSKSSVFI